MNHCLICDRRVKAGQQVVCLEHGVLEYRGWGHRLKRIEFEDGDTKKWLHWPCAKNKHGVSTVHLKSEHCILCNRGFDYEGDGYPGECVLKVDRGMINNHHRRPEFQSAHGGYIHFVCAVFENWLLPLRYEPSDA